MIAKINRMLWNIIKLWFLLVIVGALIVGVFGCATYNPNNAHPTNRDLAGMTPNNLNCPAGSTMFCNVEGGGLVGKTYSNCKCRY